MDAIKKTEVMPTDEQVAEWQRLAEIGYTAHQNCVVEQCRGAVWARLGVTESLQWINAAEAIEIDLHKKHAQTIASTAAEVERLRADAKCFAALADRAEWVRESSGGHWVIKLHNKRHTSFAQTVAALTNQQPTE